MNTIANAAPTCVRLRCATGVDPGCGGESRAIAPTRGIRAMTSEATRDRVAYKPISTDRSQAEGIAGFASRGMELQTVTFRYKRGFRHECICHDDVYR